MPFNKNRNSRDDKSGRGPKKSTRSESTGRSKSENSSSKSSSSGFNKKDDSGFNKDRKPFGSRESSGDKKPYGARGESSFQDRKAYGGKREGPSDKKPYGSREGSSYGDKKPYGSRSEGSADRKPYGSREGSSFGDKKPYGSRSEGSSDRKPYGDKREGSADRKPYGSREGSSFGDKKPYGSRNESSSERKPYSSREGSSDRKPYGDKRDSSDRKPYATREASSYDRKPREDAGERKPYADKVRQPRNNDRKSSESPNDDQVKLRSRSSNKPAFKKDGELVRLNRFISNAGICSRRKADELIEAGVITVNGEAVAELGAKVNPMVDEIRYNGQLLKREKMVYVLLNKPKDYITTTDDPQERKTVMELVDKASRERIYPVGRLDRNTTGLLLLTNDGELADRLSHPKNSISKIYQVELNKNLSQGDFNKIAFGLELEDGLIKPDEVKYVTGGAKNEIGIQIHSGKNRIVRRIFESLGYEVVKLDRVIYANLTKKDLTRGRWRYLTEQEIMQLKHFVK
jgi:23S rRNA pseudouridine2605 synthase